MPHPGPASGTPGSESTPAGRHAVQLRGLVETALAMHATLTLDDVLRIVTEKLRDVIGAHVAMAGLTTDENAAPAIRHVSLSDEHAARWGSDDVDAAWRRSGEHLPPDGRLAAPLTGRDGRAIGLIQLFDKIDGEFTGDDEAMVLQFARMASVAVENARLYGDAERRRREAEILADLAQIITSSLDLDTVLRRVAGGAEELSHGDLGEVALWDATAQAMVLQYWARESPPGYGNLRVEPGKGTGGQVMATGCPFRTDDYARDPRITKDYLAATLEVGIVSQIVVPIRLDDRIEGLLYLGRRSGQPFTDADEARLLRLAHHAGIAIENARLYAEADRQRRQAESLAAVAHGLSQSLDLQRVGQRIVDSVRTLLDAIAATLFRLDPGSGDLIAINVSGEVSPSWRAGVVIPWGTSASGRAVAERRPVSTLDVLTDPAIENPPHVRARSVEAGYRAVLAVPLLIQDRVIGALGVGRVAGRGFDEGETRLAQAFADQAAVALENARLFDEQARLLDETRRQREEAEALELVALQITSSLEREEVFQRIVDRTRELCGCDVAFLATYDAATDSGPIVAIAGTGSEAPLSITISRGRGLGGKVLETGQPCTTDDYLHDPEIPQPFVEVAQAVGTVAEAVVPLQVRGDTVGLLGAIYRTPRRFTAQDIDLLSKFAVQAAIALENSRLYAEGMRDQVELQVRARQQAAIAGLGQQALAEANVAAMMDEAIGLVSRTLDVEYCGVLDLLPGGDVLLLRGGSGWHDGYVGRATVGAGAASQAGYTLLRDGPVVVEDVGADDRFTAAALLREHGVVSGLSVVIRGPGLPFGVLGAHTRQRRSFTADDVHFLQSVANVLGAAIGRRQAEDALRGSEARFRAAFDQSRIGRSLQSMDGRYLRVNEALCDIVGYSEEELLATSWQAITHPEDVEGRLEWSGTPAGAESSYFGEKRYFHKDGHVVWVALSVSLLRDPDGRPVHYLAEVEDVTRRKQAEEALRQHAQRLRILHEIDRAIIEAKSPEAIARAAVRRIRRLVPCKRAGVVRFDFDAGRAVLLAADSDGVSRVPAGTALPLAELGDLDDLRGGKVRVVDDVLSPSSPDLVPALKGDGVRSYVEVPLWSRNELIGSLNLCAEAPGAFPADQVQIAREVADSLAVALQDSQLFAQVLAGRQRLQTLSRRLVDVQETERRHLARELHDEIGQILTGLKLTLEMAERAPGHHARREWEDAQKLLEDLIIRVRELSLDLRPAMLDDLGLLPALLWHFERYGKLSGIRVKFSHGGLGHRLPTAIETGAYRIVQEALTNVARHAGVREASVWVWTDGDAVTVHVEDLGRGFDVGHTSTSGVGLTGMRERAELLGGHLVVDSAPGAGTRVTAGIPVDRRSRRRRAAR